MFLGASLYYKWHWDTSPSGSSLAPTITGIETCRSNPLQGGLQKLQEDLRSLGPSCFLFFPKPWCLEVFQVVSEFQQSLEVTETWWSRSLFDVVMWKPLFKIDGLQRNLAHCAAVISVLPYDAMTSPMLLWALTGAQAVWVASLNVICSGLYVSSTMFDFGGNSRSALLAIAVWPRVELGTKTEKHTHTHTRARTHTHTHTHTHTRRQRSWDLAWLLHSSGTSRLACNDVVSWPHWLTCELFVMFSYVVSLRLQALYDPNGVMNVRVSHEASLCTNKVKQLRWVLLGFEQR